MGNMVHWEWGDNTLQDIENIREAIKPYSTSPFNSIDWDKLFGRIIEVGLRRQIDQQKSANLTPSEKEKLEQERDKFRDQALSIYKWFAYYQEKCKLMEKKTGKFVIPEFPDEEYPADSGPLGF